MSFSDYPICIALNSRLTADEQEVCEFLGLSYPVDPEEAVRMAENGDLGRLLWAAVADKGIEAATQVGLGVHRAMPKRVIAKCPVCDQPNTRCLGHKPGDDSNEEVA